MAVTTVVVVTVVVGAGVVAAVVVGEGGGVGQGGAMWQEAKSKRGGTQPVAARTLRTSRDVVPYVLFNDIGNLNGSVVQWFVTCSYFVS